MIELIVQALRFGLVGLANTAIGLIAIYSAIFFFDAGPVAANAFGYALGMGVSFLLNRIWTFSDSQAISKVLPRYLFAAALAYSSNLAMVLTLPRFFNVGRYEVQLCGIVVYTFLMFFLCRLYVFKRFTSDPYQDSR